MLERRYDYFPFGLAYDAGTSVVVEQRYTYTGREANPASPLMYYRYRQYGPRVGRFGGRDPLKQEGLRNSYSLADGDPVDMIDSHGDLPYDPFEVPDLPPLPPSIFGPPQEAETPAGPTGYTTNCFGYALQQEGWIGGPEDNYELSELASTRRGWDIDTGERAVGWFCDELEAGYGASMK
jgi:RHS repeat-associated protein